MTKPPTSVPSEFLAESPVASLAVSTLAVYLFSSPSLTIWPAAFWWMTTTSKSVEAAPFWASSFS